jgi:uncharacterized membrane protein
VSTLQPDQTSRTSDPAQSTSKQNQLELPSNQNNRLNSNQPSLLTSDPIDFTEPQQIIRRPDLTRLQDPCLILEERLIL